MPTNLLLASTVKILFCTPIEIKQELGAPRVLLGVAQGLQALGWEYRVAGPDEVQWRGETRGSYSDALRTYLQEVASDYDVVDYPHDQLPFPRSDFSKGTLFVARSVLLDHHSVGLKIPEVLLLRQRIKRWLVHGKQCQQRRFADMLESARLTMDNADLVNVANEDDRQVLTALGVDGKKIVVVPYGLSDDEFRVLAAVNRQPPQTPRLCFLGTFDHRKGGADLPRLFTEVCARVPDCRFRLIGTAGLHQTAERVCSFFPRRLRERLEVVPRFRRDELAALLDGCSVGVFPSYWEGFGFGVLEMMAAGLPIVAYRSPGPTMMLSDAFLVARGNREAMAARIVDWLNNAGERRRRAVWCRQRARGFSWQEVGSLTARFYNTFVASRN